MNYGKNQRALLNFLEKYPNRWHRIKRRKAIDAAKRLQKNKVISVISNKSFCLVVFNMPQMLIKQNY